MAATVCTRSPGKSELGRRCTRAPSAPRLMPPPRLCHPISLGHHVPSKSAPETTFCCLLTRSLSRRFPATWFGGALAHGALTLSHSLGQLEKGTRGELSSSQIFPGTGGGGCRSPLAGDCLAVSGLHSLSFHQGTRVWPESARTMKSNNHAFVSQG